MSTSMFGPYAAFIVTAYAVVAIVVATLMVWIVADYRHQQATLRKLEASGIIKRSERQSS